MYGIISKGDLMSNRKNIKMDVKKKISWMKSDGKCSMCNVKIGFYDSPDFIGEFAHIEDLQCATTRFNSTKSIEELNDESNIILLCPNCHTMIDKNSEQYDVETLQEIKNRHETNVLFSKEYANQEFYSIFSEICQELIKKCVDTKRNERYMSIKVCEKIKKNSLDSIKDNIEMYLEYIPIFKEFLQTLSQTTRTELRYAVISAYREEVNKNIGEVEIFMNLIRKVSNNNMMNSFQAGIVICNYFEECDVFEI